MKKFSQETIDKIWEEANRKYPLYSQISELFSKDSYIYDDHSSDLTTIAAADYYWEAVRIFLLLVLAAEGEL